MAYKIPLSDLEATVALVIPKLKVEVASEYVAVPSQAGKFYKKDKILLSYGHCGTLFLDHNPQIWLFKYRFSRLGDKIKRTRKFVHPASASAAHDHKNKFGGGTRTGELIFMNMETEWPLPDMHVKFDPNIKYARWYSRYDKTIKHTNTIGLPCAFDETYSVFSQKKNVASPGCFVGRKNCGRGNKHSKTKLLFKFAIVIDNPDGSGNKIFGPMSETIIVEKSKAPDNNANVSMLNTMSIDYSGIIPVNQQIGNSNINDYQFILSVPSNTTLYNLPTMSNIMLNSLDIANSIINFRLSTGTSGNAIDPFSSLGALETGVPGTPVSGTSVVKCYNHWKISIDNNRPRFRK